MKQFKFFVFLTIIIIGAKAHAQSFIDENANGVNICYSILYNGLEVEVTPINPLYSGRIIIPEEVTYEDKTYKVVVIGEGAFSGCENLTSVTIPNNVRTIEKRAFEGCTNLKSVNIPDKVTVIEEEAFRKCTSLTSVIIPEKVTSIENSAFSGCTGLTSVLIGNGVAHVGAGIFYNCTSLSYVKIGNNVKNIGEDMFNECHNLSSIDIPNSVKKIEDRAFGYCYSLKSIVIPNSVTRIGVNAFYRCLRLSSVILGNGLETLESGIFESCESLTSVVIGNSVTSIGANAFSNCSSLKSIIIPNSVTSIGTTAFSNCTELTSAVIGKNVKDFGNNVFNYTNKLDTIISLNENPSSFKGKGYMENGYMVGVFNDMTFDSAILYIPYGTIEKYKATSGWKDFRFIEENVEKCDKPTILYSEGKLKFKCNTEGATFQTTITDPDVDFFRADEIDLAMTYQISVYATKAGYEDSEVATATICWRDGKLTFEGFSDVDTKSIYDLNGDGKISAGDIQVIINEMKK